MSIGDTVIMCVLWRLTRPLEPSRPHT